ncbi:hypothetical protein K1T71_005595 [Dendrolimus kikuchii]|uniref:Uncharacterized protein n=1 Tax=Dendrolimus kikuchii TaxID=765133 RepID=A0ACC1D4V1_9NEOP|nr:hypothetical protein K1T71_005595 [Dendrolimus kikuchii]
MIARDVKFHESPNTRKDISKQEPSLLNITKDDDQDFIEIDFTKSNVPVEKHRHKAEEIDNMQDIWSECQEYPSEYDRDESSSRYLQAEQQAEETRHDALDQLRMTTRAPGRPRILRTGSVGRPKKIYQTREVERSVTSTDTNEVEDFAGSTEITLKNALKTILSSVKIEFMIEPSFQSESSYVEYRVLSSQSGQIEHVTNAFKSDETSPTTGQLKA